MVASFSPHRDTGGTLHLPSPPSIYHVDASSAIRQLRRSLSRSPSKSADFRLFSTRAHPPTPTAPFVPSLLSPSRRASQVNSVVISTSSTPTPVAIPFPPSAKINKPVMRRSGPLPTTKTRTSPKSPPKRALHVSSDHGNASPGRIALSSPVDKTTAERSPFQPKIERMAEVPPSALENNLVHKPAPTRIEKRRSGQFASVLSASPLKRSDGIMNLDQAGSDSPSAKRRSLHGVNLSSDFNIFDSNEKDSGNLANDNVASEFETQGNFLGISPSSPFATVPRRSSSLRKSTLQQRQNDRSFMSRIRSQVDGSRTPPGSPTRHRMSLDSNLYIASSREGSPASHPVAAPSAPSPIFATNPSTSSFTSHAAHPLSRTITQSSSSSSIPDESPTHEPLHPLGDRPRAVFNFSKSLPAGSVRPGPTRKLTREDSTSSNDSFATPENYKLVKPLPAAFMSTGLISKKNRNAEDPQNPLAASKNMPDTPCKRSTNFLPTAHKPLPVRPVERPKLVRQRFAVPSTPSQSQHVPPATGPFARGTGIFGNVFSKPEIPRRDSFVSVDGDDASLSQSPSTQIDGQTITECDLPPTPTKTVFQTPLNPVVSSTRPGRHVTADSQGPAASTITEKLGSSSPQTPKETFFPPDPSRLSISAPCERPPFAPNELSSSGSAFPATPTAPRESFTQAGKRASLPITDYNVLDIDPTLTARFDKVELIGTGEFSQVYRVSKSPDVSPYKSIFQLPAKALVASPTVPERVWAVKKSKHPYAGAKDRERRLREVNVLKALGKSDHVISFVDSWEDKNHLYIQTEFCEEGSLDVFLAQVGLKARLDDFRIWKILLELSLGLKHVHDSGFIHLDLKPANVLITFEGVLKIADFGMATTWPAEAGIDGEGDREYIGPEILMGRYDKPADIFALGLIMFEIAGNVELPDNGLSWQKLRNGDMSDVPSLTWSSETSIFRDASGNPLSAGPSFDELCTSDAGDDEFGPGTFLNEHHARERQAVQVSRSGELVEPPRFMIDANDDQALDKIVRWMISPLPEDRPTATQVLQSYGVQWAECRRRAGATVYEGNWGPADDMLSEDSEMIDV